MLNLINISKRYHDGENELTVLNNVTLKVAAGSSIALLGASGSGKSTLLQIAAGLERPDSGEVLFEGADLAAMSEPERAGMRRSSLGFVFQQFNLLPGLNTLDNVLFQRRLNQMPDQDDWVESLICGLRLEPLMKRPVEVLSGGQQQRVAIARALAHRPKMVFADEPTGNLHDSLSREVMKLFVRLVNEAGSSLLLVTHNPEMAGFMQRQLSLTDGNIAEH